MIVLKPYIWNIILYKTHILSDLGCCDVHMRLQYTISIEVLVAPIWWVLSSATAPMGYEWNVAQEKVDSSA